MIRFILLRNLYKLKSDCALLCQHLSNYWYMYVFFCLKLRYEVFSYEPHEETGFLHM